MSRTVRVVEIGGAGIASLDIDLEKPEVTEIPPRAQFSDLDALLQFVAKGLPSDVVGIAYSVAGPIENHNKVVVGPQIHWLDGLDLATLTTETDGLNGLPAAVFNDMETAVTGMAALLHLEYEYFLGVTWSSGIGARVWANGRILAPAEAGHMVLDPSPFAPLCGCGKRGHAEAIIGGDAIKRRVVAETQALKVRIPDGMHPCKFLDEAFGRKEKWAVALYRMIGKGMGIFLANIQNLLCLPLVVWKGKFARQALKKLEPIIRAEMKRVLIDPSWEAKMRFAFSPEPPDADAFVGAAKAFEAMVLRP